MNVGKEVVEAVVIIHITIKLDYFGVITLKTYDFSSEILKFISKIIS